MTHKEILEGNKLISTFMGKEDEHRFLFDHLNTKALYHISWDWLMPVVEKIENLHDGEYFFDICGRRSRISIMVNHNTDDNATIVEFHALNSSSKMEAIWLSVVEFIKQENK